MTGIRAQIRRHWWLLMLLAVLWILAGWLPSDFTIPAAIALIVLTGVMAAIVFPAHPLRNGTLGGIVAWYVGIPIGLAVQTVLGTIVIADGETLGSYWAELPFWLTLFVPIGTVAGFVGGLLVFLAARLSRPRAA